jgi:hypothetical protein
MQSIDVLLRIDICFANAPSWAADIRLSMLLIDILPIIEIIYQ